MINKIEIKNVFAHKNTVIEFKDGLTRLYGENEAGKSLVFEMVRWALYGAGALRTNAADYKGGEVTLWFTVDGTSYHVNRTTGSAVLYSEDDEVLARSTSVVNKKIIQIVGYGLKTFDNINAIQQGEVEKLTKLKAEERKKFLDELIGIAHIDKLVADYKSETDIISAEIRAFSTMYKTADEPVPVPATSIDVEAVNNRVAQAKLIEKQIEQYGKQLEKMVVLPDLMPELTKDQVNEELFRLENATNKANTMAKLYPALSRLFDAGAVEVDFAQLSEAIAVLQSLNMARKPRLSLSDIEIERVKHRQQADWEAVERLRVELSTYQSCPRCGLSFEKEAAACTAKINALLQTARPNRNLTSREALDEMENEWTEYQRLQQRVDSVDLSIARVVGTDFKNTKEEWETFKQAQYDAQSKHGSYKNLLRAASIKREKDSLNQLQQTVDELKIELNKFDLNVLVEQLVRAKAEEAAYNAYLRQLENYEAVVKENDSIDKKIETKNSELEENRKVIKALKAFKYHVNTYFLPAVGKAASAMLTTMTNGKRRRITISNKFEIEVDGGAVEGLSGSTKAIVNIALRFALMYVLTKNTFSVMLADEIDGAMDDNRAKYLNESLGNMTKDIKQVVVISHKPITAQHNIKL